MFLVSSVGSSLAGVFTQQPLAPREARGAGGGEVCSCPEGLPTSTVRAVPISRMQSRMGMCCAASLLWSLCQELQSPDQILPSDPERPRFGPPLPPAHSGAWCSGRAGRRPEGRGRGLLWSSLTPGQAGAHCVLCACLLNGCPQHREEACGGAGSGAGRPVARAGDRGF